MDFTTFDMINLFLLGSTMAFLGISLLQKKQKYPNLPPGPRGLPFLGHLLMLLKEQQDIEKNDISKKYGNIFSLQFGPYPAYVLNSFDTIKEALVDKAEYFSGRPIWLREEERQAGLLFNKNWSERRRFVLTSMRDFGLGKKSLDNRIQEEAGFLVEKIGKSDGEAVDLTLVFPNVSANIICSIIFGNRFDLEDEELGEITQTLRSLGHLTVIPLLKQFIPALKWLPVKQSKETMTLVKKVHKWKEEHRESFDPNNIRDLLDLFISETRKEGSTFNERDLFHLTVELFGAGTTTVSNSLSWVLLYLIHYPHIQAKCQQEIKQSLGTQVPDYADIKELPYINAFINECMRHSRVISALRIAIPACHTTKCDTELGGYTIPANSIIIVNFAAALRDPKYWDDPNRFNPDRWLDDQGNIIKYPAFIPFSMGKRACLGEQLAKRELFIFLVVMLQNFTFQMDDESNPPSLTAAPGESFKLRAYKL